MTVKGRGQASGAGPGDRQGRGLVAGRGRDRGQSRGTGRGRGRASGTGPGLERLSSGLRPPGWAGGLALRTKTPEGHGDLFPDRLVILLKQSIVFRAGNSQYIPPALRGNKPFQFLVVSSGLDFEIIIEISVVGECAQFEADL